MPFYTYSFKIYVQYIITLNDVERYIKLYTHLGFWGEVIIKEL